MGIIKGCGYWGIGLGGGYSTAKQMSKAEPEQLKTDTLALAGKQLTQTQTNQNIKT